MLLLTLFSVIISPGVLRSTDHGYKVGMMDIGSYGMFQKEVSTDAHFDANLPDALSVVNEKEKSNF